MANIDPYQILGIPTDATLDVAKEAYKTLAIKNHPDKPGGSQETFKIIKLAFKMIVDNINKGIAIPQTQTATFTEMKEQAKALPTVKMSTPAEFFGQDTPLDPNREFQDKEFNRRFVEKIQGNADYVLGQVPEDYREKRTREQLLSERQNIDSELSTIKPIFKGKIDPNVFQRLFEQINGSAGDRKDLQNYEEPIALTSGLQPYTEIEGQKMTQTSGLSSLCFSDVNNGFGQKNPQQFERSIIEQLSKQPDITDVKTLEPEYHATMKKRLSDYQNLQTNFHPKPADVSQLPDQLKPTNATCDSLPEQRLNDMFSRKMQERNILINELKGHPTNTPQTQFPPTQYQPQTQHQNQHQIQPQHQIQLQPQQLRPQINPRQRTIPIMDYPRNSNIPQNQTSFDDDYFSKIPTAQQPQTYATPYTHPQPQPQSSHELEQLRLQLMSLQKTVNQQNRVIRSIKGKKKGT
jgi:curved DNA-binding protein CbpA